MKVYQLIELLRTLDQDASVYVAIQPEYPFEVTLEGIAVRRDFTEPDDAGEGEEPSRSRWTASAGSLPGNDVILVTGGQVRYGDHGAWDALRRA